MSLQSELENLCGIEEEFIKELFDDFFESRGIEIKKYIDFSDEKYYTYCEIFKIEIKNGKTYDDFITQALKKITNYYLDGYDSIRGMTREESYKYVLQQLNQYSPVEAIPCKYIESLKNIKINGSTFIDGKEFINHLEGLKSHKERKEVCKDFSFKKIEASDLYSDEKYILSNGSIRTSRQILGYLHGDIGEFILFLLVEGFLKSPLLFSKINHCKSSPGDKIKGSDGIHIELDDNNNYIYNFLESKINKDFSSSLKQVIESNEEFLENNGEGDINNEMSILFSNKSHIDNKYQFLFNGDYNSHLIPYLVNKSKQTELLFNIVCLLSYNCIEYKKMKDLVLPSSDYIDSNTIKRITLILEKYKAIEDKLNNRKVRIFLLPLVDELDFIRIFLDKIKQN